MQAQWNLFCLSPSGRFPDRLWQICQKILWGATTQCVLVVTHLSSMDSVGSLHAVTLTCMWECTWELPRHFRGSMDTTGRGCSRLRSFPIWQSFWQERSVVVRHWKGMVLMSWSLSLHTSQIYLELNFVMQNLFTDCSTCWIAVQKMFTWLSFFAQPVSNSMH